MTNENIHNELEQIAPNIARIRKMKDINQAVPENYFDELEENIFSQVMMDRALFKQMPDQHYFKNVEDAIYKEVRPLQKIRSTKIWLRYAASFVGIITVSLGLWKTNTFNNNSILENQYSNVSMDAFVDELSDNEMDNLYSLLNYNNSLQEPLDIEALIEGDLQSSLK